MSSLSSVRKVFGALVLYVWGIWIDSYSETSFGGCLFLDEVVWGLNSKFVGIFKGSILNFVKVFWFVD